MDQAKLKAEAAEVARKARAEVHARVAAARTNDGGSYEVGADGKRHLAKPATKDYVHDAAKHAAAVQSQRDEIAAAQAEADARAAASATILVKRETEGTLDAPASAAVVDATNTSNTGKKR